MEKWDLRPIPRGKPGVVGYRENLTYYDGSEEAAKRYTSRPEYAGTVPRPYSEAPPEVRGAPQNASGCQRQDEDEQ